MATYVALLRAINLGRTNRMAMAQLRDLLEGLGYDDVRTLKQSGNAVFTSSRRSADKVAAEIERAIDAELRMAIRVVVRTTTELAAAIEANQLAAEDRDPTRLLVLFLSAAPEPARVPGPEAAPEEWQVGGREIYLWCPGGVQKSRLVTTFTERRLGVVSTTRNWRTVLDLAAMAR